MRMQIPTENSEKGYEIIHIRDGEIYIFRCGFGEEGRLLDEVMRYAKSGKTNFDGFDANVVSASLDWQRETQGN